MAKIVTFINEKGGVGKTSSCFNSAWELASRGKSVLMIDMDGQKANLSFFAGLTNSDDMLTIADVFKSEVSIGETIKRRKENLYLIPADTRVSNLDMTAKVSKFRKAIAEIKDEFDFIFIDVNPTPGWSHYLSLSVSDYAIIVMLPDIASLEANRGILETIEEIQDTTNPPLKIMGILFNKNNSRTVLAKQVFDAAEAMAHKMDSKIFDVKIRNAVALSENILSHEGITDYDPKSAAADDIRLLVDEILKGVNEIG